MTGQEFQHTRGATIQWGEPRDIHHRHPILDFAHTHTHTHTLHTYRSDECLLSHSLSLCTEFHAHSSWPVPLRKKSAGITYTIRTERNDEVFFLRLRKRFPDAMTNKSHSIYNYTPLEQWHGVAITNGYNWFITTTTVPQSKTELLAPLPFMFEVAFQIEIRLNGSPLPTSSSSSLSSLGEISYVLFVRRSYVIYFSKKAEGRLVGMGSKNTCILFLLEQHLAIISSSRLQPCEY